MAAEKGQSILANLTAEVMNDKKVEARKLTPVGGEKGYAPLERAQIPNDTGIFLSNEAMWAHAKQLRKFAVDAIAIADGIDGMLGESSDPEAEPMAPKKLSAIEQRMVGSDPEPSEDALIAEEDAEEAQADADADEAETSGPTDFAKAFAAKQAAAQAATFDWACPDHGKAAEKTSTKTGRTYIGCPDCNLFKR